MPNCSCMFVEILNYLHCDYHLKLNIANKLTYDHRYQMKLVSFLFSNLPPPTPNLGLYKNLVRS